MFNWVSANCDGLNQWKAREEGSSVVRQYNWIKLRKMPCIVHGQKALQTQLERELHAIRNWYGKT